MGEKRRTVCKDKMGNGGDWDNRRKSGKARVEAANALRGEMSRKQRDTNKVKEAKRYKGKCVRMSRQQSATCAGKQGPRISEETRAGGAQAKHALSNRIATVGFSARTADRPLHGPTELMQPLFLSNQARKTLQQGGHARAKVRVYGCVARACACDVRVRTRVVVGTRTCDELHGSAYNVGIGACHRFCSWGTCARAQMRSCAHVCMRADAPSPEACPRARCPGAARSRLEA
eukprot:2578557-Pleurochrysis_carterae.AAC.1